MSVPTALSIVSLQILGLLLGLLIHWEIQDRRVPDRLVLAILALAAIAPPPGGTTELANPARALLGILVGSGPLLAANAVRPGGIGAGDLKLAAAIGALLGPGESARMLLLACASAIVVNGARNGRGMSCDAGVAFGPYLLAGAIVVYAL